MSYIKDEGLNVSDNFRSQLTPQMVDEADKVIVITSKDSWPEYLVNNEKVIFWDISNAVGMTTESSRGIYDQVKKHVKQLVDEIG